VCETTKSMRVGSSDRPEQVKSTHMRTQTHQHGDWNTHHVSDIPNLLSPSIEGLVEEQSFHEHSQHAVDIPNVPFIEGLVEGSSSPEHVTLGIE